MVSIVNIIVPVKMDKVFFINPFSSPTISERANVTEDTYRYANVIKDIVATPGVKVNVTEDTIVIKN